MKNQINRILAFVISVIILLSVVPFTTYADIWMKEGSLGEDGSTFNIEYAEDSYYELPASSKMLLFSGNSSNKTEVINDKTVNYYTVVAEGNGKLEAKATIKSNTKYRFSANVKYLGEGNSTDKVGFTFALTNALGKFTDIKAENLAKTVSDSSYLESYEFTTGKIGKKDNFKATFNVPNALVSGYLANASLYEIDESGNAIGDNLISNGDFATGDATGWTRSGSFNFFRFFDIPENFFSKVTPNNIHAIQYRDTADYALLQQMMSVKPSTKYEVSYTSLVNGLVNEPYGVLYQKIFKNVETLEEAKTVDNDPEKVLDSAWTYLNDNERNENLANPDVVTTKWGLNEAALRATLGDRFDSSDIKNQAIRVTKTFKTSELLRESSDSNLSVRFYFMSGSSGYISDFAVYELDENGNRVGNNLIIDGDFSLGYSQFGSATPWKYSNEGNIRNIELEKGFFENYTVPAEIMKSDGSKSNETYGNQLFVDPDSRYYFSGNLVRTNFVGLTPEVLYRSISQNGEYVSIPFEMYFDSTRYYFETQGGFLIPDDAMLNAEGKADIIVRLNNLDHGKGYFCSLTLTQDNFSRNLFDDSKVNKNSFIKIPYDPEIFMLFEGDDGFEDFDWYDFDDLDNSKGAISGRLLDGEDNPCEGIKMQLMPENIAATTDPEGKYSFKNISAGKHYLYVLEGGTNEIYCGEVEVKEGMLSDISDIHLKYQSVESSNIADPDSLSWNDLVAKMPSALKGKTFTVVSWSPVTDVTDADKVVKKFEKDTGMKVKWTKMGYETYDTNIAALINAGKSPDLIRYISPAPSRMTLCQDLKSATGFDFSGDIWDSRVMKAYSYKGKYYAANLRNTLNQQPTVVVYRPSLIKQYKLEDPYTLWKNGQWTYDKFKEMCRSFKAEVGHAAWMTSRTIDLLWLNDIDLITFDGTKYVNNLKNPAVISGLQEVIGNRDELCPEAAAESSKFENGTYLFYTDNIIALRRTDFHFTELKAKNDVEAVPFPTQAGKTYYTNFQEFEAYGVPKGAKYGTAAYFFLRCYANADNYDESTFFNSERILETYKYLMNQNRYNYNVDRLITKAAGNELGDIPAMIRTGKMTADQVVTKLDSISPFFNNAVNQANDTLAKLDSTGGGSTSGGLPVVSGAYVTSDWVIKYTSIKSIPGDINSDTFVNNKDVTRLFQYLSGWAVEVNSDTIDVNNDNAVNNKDLTRLFQYLSGWDVKIYSADVITEDIKAEKSVSTLNTSWDKVTQNHLNGSSDSEAAALRNSVLNSKNTDEIYSITGTKYYVSPNGDDSNDGKSPQSAKKTVDSISRLYLNPGDAVFFERSGVWRLSRAIVCEEGVTYGAYGTGEKPAFYGSPQNYADKKFWQPSNLKNVWKLNINDTDIGLMVFNHGELIGQVVTNGLLSLVENGDFYYNRAQSTLYLYYDGGNPGKAFDDIEVCLNKSAFDVTRVSDVTIDNVKIKYFGRIGVDLCAADNSKITNCEIGFIGGAHINSDVRLGNAIQMWQGCDGHLVENCWIYQIYDTALTFQGDSITPEIRTRQGTHDEDYKNITYRNNLIEYCASSIEIWHGNHNDGRYGSWKYTDAVLDNIHIENNISRFAGYGWSALQRPDLHGEHLIMYSRAFPYAKDVYIENNIFDLCDAWICRWDFNLKYNEDTNDATRKKVNGVAVPIVNKNGIWTIRNNTYYHGSNRTGGINWYGSQKTGSGQSRLADVIGEFDLSPKKVIWVE